MLANLPTAAAHAGRGPLPFALRASRLPSIDVRLARPDGAAAAQEDLVVRELLAE